MQDDINHVEYSGRRSTTLSFFVFEKIFAHQTVTNRTIEICERFPDLPPYRSGWPSSMEPRGASQEVAMRPAFQAIRRRAFFGFHRAPFDRRVFNFPGRRQPGGGRPRGGGAAPAARSSGTAPRRQEQPVIARLPCRRRHFSPRAHPAMHRIFTAMGGSYSTVLTRCHRHQPENTRLSRNHRAPANEIRRAAVGSGMVQSYPQAFPLLVHMICTSAQPVFHMVALRGAVLPLSGPPCYAGCHS